MRSRGVEQAAELLERAAASGEVRAAVLDVRQAEFKYARAFGEARGIDTVFLLASITKPMTAVGVMVLADGGVLALSDRVGKFIPEFSGGERGSITVKHLLNHTSGLPDMLPENEALRRRHAPLEDFVAATCRTPLLFRPGTETRYQSMGFLLAAEIVQRVTRVPFREFLQREVFNPLGMQESSLGMAARRIESTALCQVAPEEDWNWNSPYWRDLGAPWGGAHSTAADVSRLLDLFLNPDGRVLKRETAAAMITSQTPGLNKTWGLGWMLGEELFGRPFLPQAFGHYGATGTMAWADPAANVRCVLLTTKPGDQSRSTLLGSVSDLVAEALKT